MSEGIVRDTGEEDLQIRNAASLLILAIEDLRSQPSFPDGMSIVTMSGEPGVGKTTLGNVMQEMYLAQGIGCALLSADGYYQQPVQEGLTTLRETSKGLSVGPTEWDIDELQRDLSRLKQGQTVPFKQIDWSTCVVSFAEVEAAGTDIVLVDHLLADFLNSDIAVRLDADPQRILDQAQQRDNSEQRETEGSDLLRQVRATERTIIRNVWETLVHSREVTLLDYETIEANTRPGLAFQTRAEKMSVLAKLSNIGLVSPQRVIGKLALIQNEVTPPDSYAELLWIEAALRLISPDQADAARRRLEVPGRVLDTSHLASLVESNK